MSGCGREMLVGSGLWRCGREERGECRYWGPGSRDQYPGLSCLSGPSSSTSTTSNTHEKLLDPLPLSLSLSLSPLLTSEQHLGPTRKPNLPDQHQYLKKQFIQRNVVFLSCYVVSVVSVECGKYNVCPCSDRLCPGNARALSLIFTLFWPRRLILKMVTKLRKFLQSSNSEWEERQET